MPKKKENKLRICIIGAGRLGLTLALCFSKNINKNLKLVSITTKSSDSLVKAKEIITKLNDQVSFFNDNYSAAKLANCILICTPDSIIKNVCDELFIDKKLEGYGKAVIHFSGSKKLDVINSAKEAGASIACIHPIKSFANYIESAKTIKNTLFGITYEKDDKAAINVIKVIIKFLNGKSVFVSNDNKPLYHACACIASNYLVALLNLATEIGENIGIKPEDYIGGLLNLSQGTLDNISKMGSKKSLTGPIARGDITTIKDHLAQLEALKFPKEYIDAYKIMGILTLEIAFKNNWLKKETFDQFIEIFSY